MHRAPHCGSVFEAGRVYPISEEFLVALPLLMQGGSWLNCREC